MIGWGVSKNLEECWRISTKWVVQFETMRRPATLPAIRMAMRLIQTISSIEFQSALLIHQQLMNSIEKMISLESLAYRLSSIVYRPMNRSDLNGRNKNLITLWLQLVAAREVRSNRSDDLEIFFLRFFVSFKLWILSIWAVSNGETIATKAKASPRKHRHETSKEPRRN